VTGPYAGYVRVVALGVLVHEDHVLLSELLHGDGGRSLLRPIGGTIEFGERAVEAVVREFLEETGLAVELWDFLGVYENLFEAGGHAGHEVVFEFVLRPAPGTLEGLPEVRVTEGDAVVAAHWAPLAEVLAGVTSVVPDGLPERLAAWVNRL
jgi:ADP-ribose pyrophosphatase YjhB (NUDIX family)